MDEEQMVAFTEALNKMQAWLDLTELTLWQHDLMMRVASGERVKAALRWGGTAERPEVYVSDTICRRILQERDLVERGFLVQGRKEVLKLTKRGWQEVAALVASGQARSALTPSLKVVAKALMRL